MKDSEVKPNTEGLTEEEIKKNRQQAKRDLKDSRQHAERKDMFDIIRQCKRLWGDLRRYNHTRARTY